MKSVFRLVFVLITACFLMQLPLSAWAKDTKNTTSSTSVVDVKEKPSTRTIKIKGATKSAKPDLVISKINFSPGLPKVNDEITIWVFVKNIGQVQAGASEVRVKVGGESNPPVLPVPALNPNEKFKYTRKITFGTVGNYIVTATADDGNDVTESNEGNNIKKKTVKVVQGPKPDLVVTKINYSPGAPKQHQQVTVWYFVKNIGPGKSGPCKLSTSNSLNLNPIWHEAPVPALDPGIEWRYQGYFISNQAGTYNLTAVIDRGDQIDETDEDNNTRDQGIVVAPPSS